MYFGWHYVVDDVAGALIAVASLLGARVLIGARVREAQAVAPKPTPIAEPA
jgi:hypothetical protein